MRLVAGAIPCIQPPERHLNSKATGGNMRNSAHVFFWACFPDSVGGGKAVLQDLLLVPNPF